MYLTSMDDMTVLCLYSHDENVKAGVHVWNIFDLTCKTNKVSVYFMLY